MNRRRFLSGALAAFALSTGLARTQIEPEGQITANRIWLTADEMRQIFPSDAHDYVAFVHPTILHDLKDPPTVLYGDRSDPESWDTIDGVKLLSGELI